MEVLARDATGEGRKDHGGCGPHFVCCFGLQHRADRV